MEQAKLLVMADFAVPRTELLQTLSEIRLLDWKSIAEIPAFRSGLLSFPEIIETQITFDGSNAEGDLLLHWCGIYIRISRNLIEFRIPALYKTWSSFSYFRIGLNRFLCAFLRPFQCENLIFLPSHWIQRESSIHNAWQRKRLQKIQTHITTNENSFKRCRLHLQHCMGENPTHKYSEIYPNYVENDFFSIDAGPLCISAVLCTPIDVETLPQYAHYITANTTFDCCPEIRDNACPFMSYSHYFTSKTRTCKLLPYYAQEKYPNLDTAIQKEGIARWNAHCFFSLELHTEHINLLFHQETTKLLYGAYKTQIITFIQHILTKFSVREILLYSAYSKEHLPANANYERLKEHLNTNFVKYNRIEDISSWSEGFVETRNIL